MQHTKHEKHIRSRLSRNIAENLVDAYETRNEHSIKFAPEIRPHIVSQIAGIFKGAYVREEDGNCVIGHEKIEAMLRSQAFDKAEKQRRRA